MRAVRCGVVVLVAAGCVLQVASSSLAVGPPPGATAAGQATVRQRRAATNNSASSASSFSRCTVSMTSEGEGLKRMFERRDTKYSFLLNPLPGFRMLQLRIIVSGYLENAPYEWRRKSLIVRAHELPQGAVGDDAWLPVRVEYYQHKMILSPDPHGLRVKVGNLTKSLPTISRWTHRYLGFTAYVKGPAKILLNCLPDKFNSTSTAVTTSAAATATPQDTGVPSSRPLRAQEQAAGVTHQGRYLVVGVVLCATSLLLLVGVLAVMVVRNCSQDDRPPPLPKHSPGVNLLARLKKVQPQPQPVYEDMSEDTLNRLRKKFDLQNLGCDNDELATLRRESQEGPHHGTLKNGAIGEVAGDPAGSKGSGEAGIITLGDTTRRAIENIYWDDGRARLLEEKQQVWREDPNLGTPPEEEYVEMHKIVSRTASLSR